MNKTKTRIKNEFETNGMLCWITSGKKIENYIHPTILDNVFELKRSIVFGRFDTIGEVLNKSKKKCGDNYNNGKVKYSKLIVPNMDIKIY